MNKNLKIMAFMAVIATVLILPLSAQTSNQLQATARIFGTEVDDYMDVNYFSGVEFSKWFGYITGGTYGIDLGYATTLGAGEEKKGTYIGTRFRGNFVSFDGTPKKQVDVTYPAPATGSDPTQIETTTSWGTGATNRVRSNNQAQVLFGIGAMGIKVGFSENLTTNMYDKSYRRDLVKTEDKTTGITTYDNETVDYSYISGTMIPSLSWGTSLDVKSMTVRPYASFSFSINQNKSVDIYKDRTVTSGTTPAGSTVTENYDTYINNGYLQPNAQVGAWFDIPKENYDLTLGLGYNFYTNLYSNDYDVPGASGTVSGIVNIVNTTGGITNNYRTVNKSIDNTKTAEHARLDISERTYYYHRVSPSLKYTRNINGLKLGFRATLPVTINPYSYNGYTEEYDVQKVRYNSEADKYLNYTTTIRTHTPGYLEERNIFSISSTLGVGASYELFSKRFTVNAGISATPFNYSNTTYKRTYPNGETRTFYKTVDGYGKTTQSYVNGPANQTKMNSVQVTETWAAFSGSASAGFVFNFNENFGVDLLAGVGTTNFENVLTDLSILFTFKF